jgi:hypothetical protein
LTGKFSDEEARQVRSYCADQGISPSLLLRELTLREIGIKSLGEVDPATAMLRLFIETTRLSIGADQAALTEFEKLVKRIAPSFAKAEEE